ncbi:hypothetical protein GTU73_01475 [Rathayibacter sp. VKM Ac-2804]|uniref:hypothetical protein n=1 Tax=Rathayibacter sp. VKM Ac-2804 TaxID=2609257 RepID=UPI00132F3236|nr:hypothetical protein [Rathayibacter sp. VKM Ac-2804]QHF22804.1 hypothetical protein GTU73_01475 [Rathayibacter sp. VKM Ac-2804]
MSADQLGSGMVAEQLGGRPYRKRSHLRWIVPLVSAPVAFVGFGWSQYLVWLSAAEGDLQSLLLQLALLAAAFLVPVAAVIVAIVQAVIVHGRARRAKGRFTATERATIEAREASDRGRGAAVDLRALLLARQLPAEIRVWDVVPGPGEFFFLDTRADYFRYYGRDVSYTRTSGFYVGRPAFVAAGLFANAVSNTVNASVAHAQAQAQWRDRQQVRLLVSNQRLVCQVSGGRWLSFHYSAMTAVHPEVDSWTLVTQFDSAEPLMLRGVDVPAAAVLTVRMTHGEDALGRHPGLMSLEGKD